MLVISQINPFNMSNEKYFDITKKGFYSFMCTSLTKKNKRNEANFDSYVGDFTEVDTPKTGFKRI